MVTIRFERWIDAVRLDLLEAGAGDLRVDGYVNAKTVPYGMLAGTTQGAYEFSYAGMTTTAPAGTVLFAPPMTPVEIVHRIDPERGMIEFRFVHLRFTLWGGVDLFAVLRPQPLFTGAEAQRLNELMAALLDVAALGPSITALARRQEIGYALLGIISSEAGVTPGSADLVEGTAGLLPTLRLLRERYTEPWTVDEIARQARVSRAGLHRQFNQLTGMSPIEYLRRLRLDDAAWRLANSPASVADVAAAVGYANPFHFSREFARRFGAPPSVYRRDRVFAEIGSKG